MTSPQRARQFQADDLRRPPAPIPHRRSKSHARRAPLVLFADDSVDTRELYAEYLRYQGFQVLTAADGDGAMEVALTFRPDLMIVDLSMPRLNGISVACRLRRDRRTRRMPIIMLTGYAFRAIEQGALEAGVDVFLTKPCLPEDLEGHVKQLLQRNK
jgi:DNA-binding response OmpR family regulator